jgi:DNA-binding transcriptional regulator YiaG
VIEQKDLKSIRKKHGLTQKDLASMLHVSLQSVKFYESFTRKISSSMLELLSYKLKDLICEQKKAILQ